MNDPIDFDQWRAEYDTSTYQKQQAFYNQVWEEYPIQHHYRENCVQKFLCGLPVSSVIMEIGGWDGELACTMLTEFPSIKYWYNYEICRSAIEHGYKHEKYYPILPTDWVWNVEWPQKTIALIASHVIEHIRAVQLIALIERVEESVIQYLYIDAPLSPSRIDQNWNGEESTHILEYGWKEVHDLLFSHGWEIYYYKETEDFPYYWKWRNGSEVIDPIWQSLD